MGIRARKYFERADSLGGLRAKIRLATLSHITSTEADSLSETPEIIARLERAMTFVQDEFGRSATSSSQRLQISRLSARVDDGAAGMLRRHIATFLELLTQRNLFFTDVKATYQRITEASATTLDVSRAGIWLVDQGVTKLTCADVFERSMATHLEGDELSGEEYAPYFHALRDERTIAAHDAHTDPRTSCFSMSYFKPQGINSTLDVPIWVNDVMVGVLCHEHKGLKRTWNSDEENFAYLMANIVAQVMERRGVERASGGERPSRV